MTTWVFMAATKVEEEASQRMTFCKEFLKVSASQTTGHYKQHVASSRYEVVASSSSHLSIRNYREERFPIKISGMRSFELEVLCQQ